MFFSIHFFFAISLVGQAGETDLEKSVIRGVHSDRSIDFSTACAPLSTLVALRCLGVDTKFDNVAHDLNWQEGSRINLGNIVDCLNSNSKVKSELRIINSSQLDNCLEAGGVVLVAVRKGRSSKPNHVFCIYGISDDGYTYFDLPDTLQTIDSQYLTKIWLGESIVCMPRTDFFFGMEWPFRISAVLLAVLCFALRDRKPLLKPLSHSS